MLSAEAMTLNDQGRAEQSSRVLGWSISGGPRQRKTACQGCGARYHIFGRIEMRLVRSKSRLGFSHVEVFVQPGLCISTTEEDRGSARIRSSTHDTT